MAVWYMKTAILYCVNGAWLENTSATELMHEGSWQAPIFQEWCLFGKDISYTIHDNRG